MTIKTVAAGIGITLLVTTAAAASLLNASNQTLASSNQTQLPPATMHCPYGNAEDDCIPDYTGDGNWVLRNGNGRMPECTNPRITDRMVADCNKLAQRPAEKTAEYENPAGPILVKECLDSYDNELELGICFQQ